jgi:hypothetical protein
MARNAASTTSKRFNQKIKKAPGKGPIYKTPPMDNVQTTGQPLSGLGYVVICGIGSFFSWINFHNIDTLFAFVVKLVSVGAGIMAFRHYYLMNPFKSFNLFKRNK